MKNLLTCFCLCMLLIISLSVTATAQLEAIFPFSEQQVDNYYIKTKITTYYTPDGQNTATTEVYYLDNTIISQFEVGGNLVQYQNVIEPTWEPDLDLNLFFSNYELKIVDTKLVAGRECIVIDLYRKNNGQLVITYVVDKETRLTLEQYRYNPQGNLFFVTEVLEVDYDPDISAIDFDNIPKFNLSIHQLPLSQADFLKLAPWINLTALPLPEGFEIIGYSQADYPQELLEGNWLNTNYPSLPITHLWIWASDGYYHGFINIAFATAQKIELSPNSGLEIIENTSDSTIVTIPDHPLTIEMVNELTTPEQRIAILQALTNIDQIFNPQALILEADNGVLFPCH